MAAGNTALQESSRELQVMLLVTAALFGVLYWDAFSTLPSEWWSNPDASHGMLLVPIACWLAWREGLVANRSPNQAAGILLLMFAACLRFAGGLAAEPFTVRLSMLLALTSLVVFMFGGRQVKAWWLPFSLLLLSLPIPAVLTSTIALPLQLEASQLGASMLRARYVPVEVTGNVIRLPGQTLFVTEACSGLRSLTALVALALLFSGLFLRGPAMRVTLVLCAIPVAILLNSVRIFATGFLVHFVSPSVGSGFLHYTEGWLIFVLAMGILGIIGWILSRFDRKAVA